MNRFCPIFGAALYAWPMAPQYYADAVDIGSAYRPVHVLLDQPDDGAFPLQAAPAMSSYGVVASGNVTLLPSDIPTLQQLADHAIRIALASMAAKASDDLANHSMSAIHVNHGGFPRTLIR